MRGDNPSGAGNQQERPGLEQWVVGFVDGEGCFSIFGRAQSRVPPRLAGPARVLGHLGGAVEASPRTPPTGVRVRAAHREPAPRQPSPHPPALLREAEAGAGRGRGSVLRRPPTGHREASRLRGVRLRPANDAGGGASPRGRPPPDRRCHRADEPAGAVSVPGILRGHTPTSSVRHRAEDMVLAPWRHGES
jgi:hypothetical protein